MINVVNQINNIFIDQKCTAMHALQLNTFCCAIWDSYFPLIIFMVVQNIKKHIESCNHFRWTIDKAQI
jgi:hypothetical protein